MRMQHMGSTGAHVFITMVHVRPVAILSRGHGHRRLGTWAPGVLELSCPGGPRTPCIDTEVVILALTRGYVDTYRYRCTS